ncbi:VIT1/CCC1 transporter family protein [Candidatus Chlamydia sanziniae]|uniref:VIT family protein n=1 Tax=Candidatus Chlamydia sanziniae TaxID=1806891 RepID=A0A1A9HV03_9CHLA|nr:VIT1/CCC1 transporter family protein [Candidatus Chlamydia sanziniae]ANH78665.1 hypothetical protein Cs308_0494 [Candidatus Chlamydia sanziniae]
MNTNSNHFKSLTPGDHVKVIKDKHSICKGEPHTTAKGFFYHLASNAVATGVFLFFIRTLFFLIPTNYMTQVKMLVSLGLGWIFYHGCLTARKAWAYMELSHRSMLQEKEEIENHLDQEKAELRVIFTHQGFKDSLLEEMIDYVSSDTTLLLDTMIRNELGIHKEDFPHPLVQGGTCMLGGFLGFILFLPLVICVSYTLSGILTAIVIIILSIIKAKILENDSITEFVWMLGIFLTAISIVCSLIKFL